MNYQEMHSDTGIKKFKMNTLFETIKSKLKNKFTKTKKNKDINWYRAYDYYKTAWTFDKGEGAKVNTKKAIYWYRRSALAGYDVAQYNLGVLIETGHEGKIKGNPLKAEYWYRMAANQSNVNSLYALGRLFWNKHDYHLSFYHFMRAAEYDNIMAITNIGSMYLIGFGVKKDTERALYYLRLAATHDNTIALHNIGIAYENGYGVPVNLDIAEKYYATAIDATTANYIIFKSTSDNLRKIRKPLICN
jgi:TPR repeat protein